MSGQRSFAAIQQGSSTRIAVICNVGLVLSLAVVWLNMARQGLFWRADFTNYYTGWSMVLDGRGDRLYDLDLQSQYQHRIVAERGVTGGLLPFNYPPHLAIPACLFALLPRSTAFYVWSFGQLLLLVPLIHFVRRLADEDRPRSLAVVLTAVLAFPPLFMSFQLGQVSLLVLVCLLGFTCNLKAGRPLATAFWLTLGTIKPQLMVAPAAILLAGRRWRELGLAAGLFAGWALLTTVFLGTFCWFAFVNVVRYSAWQFGGDGIHPLAMYNLKALLTSLLGGQRAPAINVLTMGAWLLVLLTTLRIWRGPWRRGEPEFDLRLACTLQLSSIVNPHFNPVDALVLVAPALLYYRGWRRSGRPAHGVAALLACGPLLFALDCYGTTFAARLGFHPFFLLMTVLAAVMGRAAANAGASLRTASPDAPNVRPSCA